MAKLEIRNQSRVSKINKLVEYLYKHGNDPPTLKIEKKGNDLMVTVYWTDNYSWGDPETYYLEYKVEGLTDLIGSFWDDYTTTNLDAKLSDYAKTDGSNMTDDIQNRLMSHHITQVFDFFSNLETEYNAMHG